MLCYGYLTPTRQLCTMEQFCSLAYTFKKNELSLNPTLHIREKNVLKTWGRGELGTRYNKCPDNKYAIKVDQRMIHVNIGDRWESDSLCVYVGWEEQKWKGRCYQDIHHPVLWMVKTRHSVCSQGSTEMNLMELRVRLVLDCPCLWFRELGGGDVMTAD